MKHDSAYRHSVRRPMYPGAADTNYFAEKALEILTAVLTGTGALSAMMLLVIMA